MPQSRREPPRKWDRKLSSRTIEGLSQEPRTAEQFSTIGSRFKKRERGTGLVCRHSDPLPSPFGSDDICGEGR